MQNRSNISDEIGSNLTQENFEVINKEYLKISFTELKKICSYQEMFYNDYMTLTDKVCLIEIQWPGDTSSIPECWKNMQYWLRTYDEEYPLALHIYSIKGDKGRLPSMDDIFNVLEGPTFAENLNLYGNHERSRKCMTELLKYVRIDVRQFEFDAQELENAKNLQWLEIIGSKFKNWELLKMCQSLHQLYLQFCKNLNFLSDYYSLTALKTLIVKDCSIDTIKALPRSKQLQNLHLESSTNTQQTSVVNNMQNLRTLKLSRLVRVTVDVNDHKSLEWLRSENEIKVTSTHLCLQKLEMKGIEVTANTIINLPNLQHLLLYETKISEELLQELSKLESLKELYLESKKEQTVSTVVILNIQKNLERLTLHNIFVNDVFYKIKQCNVQKIIAPGLTINAFDAFEHCSHLKYLDVKVQIKRSYETHYSYISNIEKLTLHESKINLHTLLSTCVKLQEVCLQRCTLTDKSREVEISNKELQRFSMFDCDGLYTLIFNEEHDILTELSLVRCKGLKKLITSVIEESVVRTEIESVKKSAKSKKVVNKCPHLQNIVILECKDLCSVTMALKLEQITKYVDFNHNMLNLIEMEGCYTKKDLIFDVYYEELINLPAEIYRNTHILNVSNKEIKILNGVEKFKNLKVVDISLCFEMKQINLKNQGETLVKFNASYSGLADFEWLKSMEVLSELLLEGCTKFESIQILNKLSKLNKLTLKISGISDFKLDKTCFCNLTELDVRECSRLGKINVDQGYQKINEIVILANEEKTIIEGLPGWYDCNTFKIYSHVLLESRNIQRYLNFIVRINYSNVHILKERLTINCECLTQLYIKNSCNIEQIRFIGVHNKLKSVYVENTNLIKIDDCHLCPEIETLNLSCCSQIESLHEVRHLKKLKYLEIQKTAIKSLNGIEECKELRKINAQNCQYLEDINAISGLDKLNSIDLEGCASQIQLEESDAFNEFKNRQAILASELSETETRKHCNDIWDVEEFNYLSALSRRLKTKR